jgi:ribosomal protein S18 acetylase RimI-like enzyme
MITIRRAAQADLPRIVELLQQLSMEDAREDLGPPLPAAYQEAFRQMEADPHQQLLVAELDGQVMGTLVLVTVPNLSHVGMPYAIIENVVVDAPARRTGCGELLMCHAIEEARRQGCFKVSLTCNKHREESQRFYRHLGFIATHEGFRIDF